MIDCFVAASTKKYRDNTPDKPFKLPDVKVTPKPWHGLNRCCGCKEYVPEAGHAQHFCGNTGDVIHGYCVTEEFIEQYGGNKFSTQDHWCKNCMDPWMPILDPSGTI
jgi:hypothetical protein